MTKNKKLIIINGLSEDFIPVSEKKAKERGIDFHALNSKHTCIILDREKDLAVYENNELIDFNDSYVYIKHKKHDSYFIHLLCEYFDRKNIDFNDPEINKSSQFAGNKTSQMVRMFLDGVPIPSGILCTQESYEKNKETILNNTKFPCVAKRSGSRGKNVWKIESVDELEKIISLEPAEDTTLIQELIPNTFDTRVFVFEDTILAAVHRKNANGFHNNISQGGTGEKAVISEEEKDLCIKALKSAGMTFGGADMVRDNEGNIFFFEVNKNPQIEMFEEYAEVPIREKLIEEILNRYF